MTAPVGGRRMSYDAVMTTLQKESDDGIIQGVISFLTKKTEVPEDFYTDYVDPATIAATADLSGGETSGFLSGLADAIADIAGAVEGFVPEPTDVEMFGGR